MILVLAFLAILSSAQARCSPWWGSLTCSECVVRKSLFQPCGWILTNPEDTNSGMCGRANGKKGKAAKIIHNLMTTKEMCATLDGVNSEALSISAQVAAEISPTDEQMNQVVEVTGLSKEKAIKLLKEIGGNVQAAIDSHLEGGSAALTSNSNEAARKCSHRREQHRWRQKRARDGGWTAHDYSPRQSGSWILCKLVRYVQICAHRRQSHASERSHCVRLRPCERHQGRRRKIRSTRTWVVHRAQARHRGRAKNYGEWCEVFQACDRPDQNSKRGERSSDGRHVGARLVFIQRKSSRRDNKN